MKVGILALQGAFREHREVLDALGVEAVEVRAPEAARCARRADPARRRVHHHEQAARHVGAARAARRRACATACPVLGTCAGMILLARDVVDGRPDQQSFGVDRHRRCAATPTGASATRSRRRSTSTASPADPFRGVFIRAPRIERAGDDVEVLAAYDGHPVLARQGRVWVASFHPELSGDLRLHNVFVDEVST